MQARQRTPLETRKMILLAKTESNYLKALLTGIETYFCDKLPNLQEHQDTSDYLEYEVANVVSEYNKLSDSAIRFNEQKTLENLYTTAQNIRKTMAETHQKVVNLIEPILQTAFSARKKAVINTLADSCDYKSNISKLDSMGQLERARIDAFDYTELNNAKKILREHLNFLQALTFNFSESFLELQRITNNDLRFAGLFQEHLVEDKAKIKVAAEQYKNKLVEARQTVVGICNSLMRRPETIQKAINTINSIMEGVNVIPRLPQIDVKAGETTSKRVETLSEVDLLLIRRKHMKPASAKSAKPASESPAEPSREKHMRPSGI